MKPGVKAMKIRIISRSAVVDGAHKNDREPEGDVLIARAHTHTNAHTRYTHTHTSTHTQAHTHTQAQ